VSQQLRNKWSKLAAELYRAMRARTPVAPLTERFPELGIDEAYQISRELLSLRLLDGERVVGKKIGVTSKPVQEMLNVREPDFGFLTDSMQAEDGSCVGPSYMLMQPRIEAEIAFILANGLKGPGVTAEQVLAATQAIAPCFEIVDSRIKDWKIRIQDTVADNASCGAFVLGHERIDPRNHELPALRVKVFKNEQLISEGVGAAVQGSPLQAVAWLANTLGRFGVELSAGDIILSGSLVPLTPVAGGDAFRMELLDADRRIGAASIRFE
jgi:2-oxopent-4-enoate/cis-2-oxohex-4-enoate hydratase